VTHRRAERGTTLTPATHPNCDPDDLWLFGQPNRGGNMLCYYNDGEFDDGLELPAAWQNPRRGGHGILSYWGGSTASALCNGWIGCDPSRRIPSPPDQQICDFEINDNFDPNTGFYDSVGVSLQACIP
jgi:hypothetical protein